jgi:hypothetical protein
MAEKSECVEELPLEYRLFVDSPSKSDIYTISD